MFIGNKISNLRSFIYRKLNNSTIPGFSVLMFGIKWTFFRSIVSRGITFFSWIIIARILGAELYGQYGLIRNTIFLFATFAGFGLGITGTRFVAEFFQQNSERAGRIASLTFFFSCFSGCIITIICFLLSDYLASETIHSPWLTDDLKIASLMLLTNSINGAQNGILEGLGKFKQINLVNILNAIISLPIFIIGAYSGVTGSVTAFLISSILCCIFNHIALRNETRKERVKIQISGCIKEWRILYSYSLPAALSGMAVIPIKWYADVIFINGSTFVQMGIFSAALTLNTIVISIANTINAPFLNLLASNKLEGIDSKLQNLNLYLSWIIGLVIGLPLLLFPEISNFIFGKNYAGFTFERTSVIIVLFTILMMYKQGLDRIFQIYDLQWFGLMSNLIWGGILICTLFCFRNYGACGMAVSYLCAYVVSTLVTYPIYIMRKYVPLSFFFIDIYKCNMDSYNYCSVYSFL